MGDRDKKVPGRSWTANPVYRTIEDKRGTPSDTQACRPMSTWAMWHAHSTYTHTHEYDCTERGAMSLGSPVLADFWLCFH